MSFPNRSVARFGLGGAACLFAATLAGCDDGSAPSDAPVAIAALTPEESFSEILQTFRQKIEDESIDNAAAVQAYQGGAGEPITEDNAVVQHELTPPAAEGEPYRATIRVVSDPSVTVIVPPQDPEEVEQAKAEKTEEIRQLEEQLEGVADLDSLVTPSAGAASKTIGAQIHEIKPDETSRDYELEYRDGRWELLTEFDKDQWPFYDVVMEYALKRQ